MKSSDGTVITAEQIKKYIFYPLPGGERITFEDDGTADWPDGSFTRRRINEGCVAVVDEKAETQARQQMLEKEEQWNLAHHSLVEPPPSHAGRGRSRVEARMQTAPTPRAPSLSKPALETKSS
jgi:hypothetical protein